MAKCKYPKIKRIFRNLREELNTIEKDCTQDDLASRLHLSKPQISKLENGLKEPSLTELKAYSQYFKCPMEYLLGINKSRTYDNYTVSSELGLSDTAIKLLKLWNETKKTYIYTLNMLIEHGDYFEILTYLSEYLFNLPENFSLDLDIIDKPSVKQDYVYVNNTNSSGFSISIKDVQNFVMLSLQNRLHDFQMYLASNGYNENIPNSPYHYDNYSEIQETREDLIYGKRSSKKR